MIRRNWIGAAVLVLLILLFHWKLWLTNQYTWLESPDLMSQVLPSYQFSSYELHQGRLPLWDPYTFSGQPLHGAMQASLANPLHWLFLAAPLKKSGWLLGTALNWYYILIRILVALGMFALCRDLGRSAAASILAGLIYSLGGVEITTDWPQMAHATVWIPIVLLFLFRVLRGEPALRNGVFAGAVLGLAWLSGHHGYPTVISLASVGIWTYWLAGKGHGRFAGDSEATREKLRFTDFIPPFACFLFTGLIGAVQLLPTMEFGRLARRWVGAADPLRFDEKIPYYLYDRLGLSADGVFSFLFPHIGQSYEPFLGVVAIGLGFLGAALAWREWPVRVLSVIGLGGLIFSFASYTPVHGWLYVLMPFAEKTRVPMMATVLCSVAIAGLAAYALDYVLALAQSEWNRRFVIGFAAFGLGILVLGAILEARRAEIMNGPDLFLLTGAYAVVLAIWLAAASRGKFTRNWTLAIPIALVMIELTAGPSSQWRNQQDHSRPNILQPLAEDYKIAQFLKARGGDWRVETDLPYNFGPWWGIETVDGIVAGATSNLLEQEYFSPRFRELMSVRYRVAEKPSRPDQTVVFEGPRGVKVFENPVWGPRAWVVHKAVAAGASGFDIRKQVWLKQPVALETCDGSGAELGKRIPGRVEVKVEANCKGMLVVNDVYYPGWTATVDGQQTDISEADGVWRGVVVGKGAHAVVFEYSPWSIKLGALLSLIGVLGVLVVVRRNRGP